MRLSIEKKDNYPTRESLSTDNLQVVRHLLQDTGNLVSFPQVCISLREVLADPEHTQRQVAEIISHEPALVTRLLRVVNSAYYCLDRPVANISQALGIIGEQEVNNLVMVTAIVNATKFPMPGIDIHQFWQSSIFSAVLASKISLHLEHDDSTQREMFIVGLLLNIGKLMMYHDEPALQQIIKDKMDETGEPDYVIEQEMLGFDHADVGAIMAESWNFPESLVSKISCHHHGLLPSGDTEQALLFMVGHISDRLDFENSKQFDIAKMEMTNTWLLSKLNLTQLDFNIVLQNAYNSYCKTFDAIFGAQG